MLVQHSIRRLTLFFFKERRHLLWITFSEMLQLKWNQLHPGSPLACMHTASSLHQGGGTACRHMGIAIPPLFLRNPMQSTGESSTAEYYSGGDCLGFDTAECFQLHQYNLKTIYNITRLLTDSHQYSTRDSCSHLCCSCSCCSCCCYCCCWWRCQCCWISSISNNFKVKH
jgi:hypothetical protein